MDIKLSVPKITPSQQLAVGWKQGCLGVCQFCNCQFVSSTNRAQRYCGRSCSRKAMWASKTAEEKKAIFTKVSSKLMGRNTWNKGVPCRAETRKKLSIGHKLIGHKPKVQGGNGRVAPCEQMMREMLKSQWIEQFSIKTHQSHGSGYPRVYKLDFAWPQRRRGLEIDGNSHTSRKHLDAKKDSLLATLGWQVFRVSNAQVRAWYSIFKSTGRITIRLKAS